MDRSVIEAWACELGFGKVGVCGTDEFEMQKEAVSKQPKIKERGQLRFAPRQDYPWATALIVLLWPYLPAKMPEGPDDVFIDSYYYASNQAYRASKELEKRMKEAGCKAQANVSFPAKAAAMRAGLGLIGDHDLLITPEYGSRVVIILVATNAVEAGASEEVEQKACMHCGKCRSSCPAGALGSTGMEHPERCLRNYMLEGVVVPEDTRKLIGMKLVGCDICQRVCPMQSGGEQAASLGYKLNDFLVSDEAQFKLRTDALGALIGKNAARPQRVRAQAALLAGNRKNPCDIDVLRVWSESSFEAVREHSKWALHEIERCIQGLDQSDEKR